MTNHRVEILEKWHGGIAEVASRRRAGREFPQSHSDTNSAIVVSAQQPVCHQLVDESRSRR